jgi:hypothetical protein
LSKKWCKWAKNYTYIDTCWYLKLNIYTEKQPLKFGFCTWVHWNLEWTCQDHDNHTACLFIIVQEWECLAVHVTQILSEISAWTHAPSHILCRYCVFSYIMPYHTISVYFPRLNFNTMLIEKEIILSTN